MLNNHGELLRRNCYWLKDKILGGQIKNHYNDIRNILNKNTILSKTENSHLNEILSHANKTTLFYKNYSCSSLSNFPVIDKSIIKNNYSQIASQSPWQKNTVVKMTSGSTGTPLSVIQDRRKRNRVYAELKFFGDLCGYNSHKKMAYLKVWNLGKKRNLTSFLQNIYCYEISNLSDSDISSILEDLYKKKIRVILSYASTLDIISRYASEIGHKNPYIDTIIGISETLNKTTREHLAKTFNSAKIVSRYSNNENGILAQDSGINTSFLFNSASYHIEILDFNSNSPLPNGEIGRIVVTDLFNYALPIIRYDTGDVGSISQNSNGQILIDQLFGRKVDIITNTKGEIISPHTITNLMWGKSWLDQYQFVQKSKDKYILRINSKKINNFSDIDSKLKTILGNNAEIFYDIVDEIPVLSSGKRKYILSEIE